MHVQIVIADRSEARFYDLERADSKPRLQNRITDPDARLRDREFKSDRPGRVFDHAPGGGRRGAVPHHDTAGERKPHKHEAEVFARRVVAELERMSRQDPCDRLVLMAAPAFLGLLRETLPKSLTGAKVLEVRKDLVHEDERAMIEHLPPRLFADPN